MVRCVRAAGLFCVPFLGLGWVIRAVKRSGALCVILRNKYLTCKVLGFKFKPPARYYVSPSATHKGKTMNNPGTPQLDPQLDESIRISHLEPKRGDEKKLGFLSFGHWAEVPDWTARSSACTTSTSSRQLPTRYYLQSRPRPNALSSAPASLICATKTRSTWRNLPLQQTSLRRADCSWVSPEVRPNPSSAVLRASATTRQKVKTRATWRAATSIFSSRQLRVRAWRPVLAWRVSTPPSSRSRRVCVSASGGVQALIAPPCGPRRRV